MNRKKLSYVLKLFLAMALIMFAAQSVLAGNPNPGIAPVNSSPGGNSYAEWSAEWWQWLMGINPGFPDEDPIPLLTPDGGEYPLVNQEHCPFVFLTGTWVESPEWSLTVKPNTRFYVPLLNYLTSAADGWDLPYGEAVAVLRGLNPDDFSDGELIQMAADHWLDDSTATMEVLIDGVPVENPNQYRTLSEPFVVDGDFYGLAGEIAATSGYAIILSPMQPGEHTISVDSYIDPPDYPPGFSDPFSFDVTYHVTVQPGTPSPCD